MQKKKNTRKLSDGKPASKTGKTAHCKRADLAILDEIMKKSPEEGFDIIQKMIEQDEKIYNLEQAEREDYYDKADDDDRGDWFYSDDD